MNINITKYYQLSNQWLETRSHRDRIYVLLGGLVVIFLVWYIFLERPLSNTTVLLKQQIETAKNNLQISETQSSALLQEVSKIPTQLPENTYPSLPSPDLLVKVILTPSTQIKFTSLKSLPPDATATAGKNRFQIEFESDYFDTLTYLKRLEKLPWCLAWDSLEYKVLTYPQATVKLNLRIMT